MKKRGLILGLTTLMLLCSCGYFTRYKDYYETEVPTNSRLRGTIKIPKKWDFIIDNGIVKLVDKTSNEVMAEQIVQGHLEVIGNENGYKIWNHEKLIFNENLPYDIKNPEKYEYVKGYSNAIYKHKFTDENKSFTVLDMASYYDKYLSNYYLILLIYDCFEEDILENVILSYSFGGTIGYDDY